jgi:hypothetical protein
VGHKNRITGLFYWKPAWIAYQQELGVQPKEYVKLFWAENFDSVRLVYLAWINGYEVGIKFQEPEETFDSDDSAV